MSAYCLLLPSMEVMCVGVLLTAAFYGGDLPYAPAALPPVREPSFGLTDVLETG